MRLVRPLDRYVFAEFWKIFTTTALGFPVLVSVIDLTDNLDKTSTSTATSRWGTSR
jgi:hypothetical protein